MASLAELLKKYREIILYIIVGGMTTFVYFAVYAVVKYLGVHYTINTCISWFAAVIFAFFTNKFIVFQSMKKQGTSTEFVKFVSARLLTLGIDVLFTFLLIDVLNVTEWISKILVQFIILVLNYVFSKVFIFNKKEDFSDESGRIGSDAATELVQEAEAMTPAEHRPEAATELVQETEAMAPAELRPEDCGR